MYLKYLLRFSIFNDNCHKCHFIRRSLYVLMVPFCVFIGPAEAAANTQKFPPAPGGCNLWPRVSVSHREQRFVVSPTADLCH